MGKRSKRMKMKKYAKKYATKRAALGFNKNKVENKVIVIDMVNGDDVTEEETVQVVSNTTEKEEEVRMPPPVLPEVQVVQIEEPPLQKMAVHKLAKELGVKSSDLVELINSENLGFTVKSHMSSVTGNQITEVLALLGEEE